jgi:hypothetical protein
MPRRMSVYLFNLKQGEAALKIADMLVISPYE